MIISGTIHSAVKLNVMNQQWQQKKDNLSMAKKQKEPLTQEEQMLQMYKENLQKMRESNDVEAIANKMKSGRQLTADELKELQQKSPELYQEYIKIQSEKEAYRRQLRNCKTKEEVDNLKLQKMGQFAAEAKRVENNPYISKAKKKELFERMLMRMQGFECEYREFKKSVEFSTLPKEEENTKEKTKKSETGNFLPETNTQDAVGFEQEHVAEQKNEIEASEVKAISNK